jgi:accessory colonization factor AcfC
MVRKGNPKNIQAIDDVCGVRAVEPYRVSRRL